MASKDKAAGLIDGVIDELQVKLESNSASNSDLRLAFDIAKAAGVSFHASSKVPDLVDGLESATIEDAADLRERYNH